MNIRRIHVLLNAHGMNCELAVLERNSVSVLARLR